MEKASMNIRVLMGLGVLIALAIPATARDLGQWEASDPTILNWYQSLMQPDNPTQSCCGTADSYWADEVHVRGGKTFVTVTDDREDGPLGRPHVPSGTEIEVPNHKLKFDRGNPTGHGVLFMSPGGYVFCFVQPGGARGSFAWSEAGSQAPIEIGLGDFLGFL